MRLLRNWAQVSTSSASDIAWVHAAFLEAMQFQGLSIICSDTQTILFVLMWSK